MTAAGRTALTAILLGIAADALLHTAPWGVNALGWAVLFLAAALVLLQRERPQPLASLALPAIGLLAVAGGLAWRDSQQLVALDILLMLGFTGLLALGPRGVKAGAAGLLHYAGALLLTLVQMLPGSVQFALTDVSWREVPVGAAGRRALAVLRGLIIALPALLLFGFLLSSADAAFGKLLQDVFAIDIPQAIGHMLFAVFAALVCGGFLRSLLRGGEVPRFDKPGFLRIGATEMNTAVGAVDLLFAAFVGVQFRYLFGGAALVRVAPNLSYADYARRGFFELVMVVTIVVPLLLFCEWIIDKSSAGALTAFRALAFLQVLLVAVIIVSAYRRMQLYRDEYGLTVQRVFTTAFMLWLAALLAWLCATVLAGRRERFMIGALVSGLGAVVIMHALDPEALIVRTNLERAAAGKRKLDATYALQLSADAAPAVLASFDRFGEQRPCIARHLLRDDANEAGDFRTWNYSRWRAHEAISQRRPELQELAKTCPEPRRRYDD